MAIPEFSAYVNDKLIRFEHIYSKVESPDEEGVQILSEYSYPLDRVIGNLRDNEEWTGLIYLCDSPKRTWEAFVSHFKLQEAAGGLVRSEKGEYLVIYRRGKWDLPKGKIDYDESPEEAALREVTEECGIEKISLLKEIDVTFHSYPHNSKQILKKTYWYLMQGDSKEEARPQREEDIERVEWMTEEEIHRNVFPNTYASIKRLLNGYFEKSRIT